MDATTTVNGRGRRGRRLAGVAIAGLVVALALWASPAPVVRAGVARSCAEAQDIDGALVCDEERLRDLGQLCADASVQLDPGDAIVRDRACAGPGGVARMDPDELAALAQVVDLNRASAAELASLPGVGPALAARIIAARPLASVDAVLEVHGIGPKRLAELRARARVRADRSR